jgi:hypothetical protein
MTLGRILRSLRPGRDVLESLGAHGTDADSMRLAPVVGDQNCKLGAGFEAGLDEVATIGVVGGEVVYMDDAVNPTPGQDPCAVGGVVAAELDLATVCG